MTETKKLKNSTCIEDGIKALIAHEPRFAQAYEKTGMPSLDLVDDGFNRLLSAIVSQQISVAAAHSIYKRLIDARLSDPHMIRNAEISSLRECGLSKSKIRYAKALANSTIDYPSLHHKTSEQVIAELTKITGIGQWTAEIYAMFSLGHADVFAAGDLALQESARMLFNLPNRPTAKEMKQIAQTWSPWRAVAARLLWSYYRIEKKRDGIRT